MQLAQQFEQVLCSQPFSHLGVVKNQQKSVLRVWRPNVSRITIEWENAALANVTVTSKNGLFETPLPKEYQGEVYRVIAEGLNDDKGYIDPYQFSEQAYHAVHYILIPMRIVITYPDYLNKMKINYVKYGSKCHN